MKQIQTADAVLGASGLACVVVTYDDGTGEDFTFDGTLEEARAFVRRRVLVSRESRRVEADEGGEELDRAELRAALEDAGVSVVGHVLHVAALADIPAELRNSAPDRTVAVVGARVWWKRGGAWRELGEI